MIYIYITSSKTGKEIFIRDEDENLREEEINETKP